MCAKTLKNERNTYKLLGVKILHWLSSVALFFVFWLLFRYGSLSVAFSRFADIGFRYNYFVAVGYAVLLYWFNRTYNSYLLGFTRIRLLVFKQILSQFFAVVTVYIIVSVSWNHFDLPLWFIMLLFVQIMLDTVWSFAMSNYFFKLNPRRKTLLVYRNDLDKIRFGTVHGKPTERLYKITDEIRYDGKFSELRGMLDGYDAIFVAGVNSRCRNGILKYCKENCIPGFFLPHVGDVIMQEAIHVQSFDSPVLFVNRRVLDPGYAIAKRLFDIVTSGIAIILLSPLMIITALVIHFTDGGPAFYRQTRLTKDERTFSILKFRSMRVDAEKDGVARLSSGDNDDRITPVGRIIRKCRIDELPQLINIFKGDMSVVGPRPERPEIAEQYYKDIPEFRLRLQVKAGLTGYAQIYGKYNTDPYEKLEFDLLYINHMSVLTDLQLCFATVSILFNGESTEGIAQGATTASHQVLETEEYPE